MIFGFWRERGIHGVLERCTERLRHRCARLDGERYVEQGILSILGLSPAGGHRAQNAAQASLLPVARPIPPAPVVAGVPFYHEDQVALGELRRGLGNTCPSHALNAVLGGPATSTAFPWNDSYHAAVSIL